MPKIHYTSFSVTSPKTGKLPTCYGLVVYVVDLLWTCYGETDVIDFGLDGAIDINVL